MRAFIGWHPIGVGAAVVEIREEPREASERQPTESSGLSSGHPRPSLTAWPIQGTRSRHSLSHIGNDHLYAGSGEHLALLLGDARVRDDDVDLLEAANDIAGWASEFR